MEYNKQQYLFAFLRIGLGWIFFWAFIDKVFGLGFATKAENAWLLGGSPTTGFLKFGTHGPLASFFQGLAGSVFVDWFFMIGLLLIGVALILGIGVRIAAYSGAILLFLMWLAVLPPEHNPIIDDHIIYLLILIALSTVKSGHWLGLGKKWSKTNLVRNHRILE